MRHPFLLLHLIVDTKSTPLKGRNHGVWIMMMIERDETLIVLSPGLINGQITPGL